ncbi:hypothetical protein TNCV_3956211 [Trichonephila clavipes]|nr:hypothetical protein TNCV_3956211 [Trichonephila clavipes]
MGSRIELIDLPIKKCAGVNTSKLSKSLDIGVRGLEFNIPSTWIITVSNSSYVSRDLPSARLRYYFTDFMPASQRPPICRALGGIKFHSIPSSMKYAARF